MSRMFRVENKTVKTWNPVTGCPHACSYCYARKLAETRLKHLPQYKNGFKPFRVGKELSRRFKGGIIFVSSMGDLFADVIPASWIVHVIDQIKKSPNATFLFLTKNPARYGEFVDIIPQNVIVGATIESNLMELEVSRARHPFDRYHPMRDFFACRKFVSIEPILDFDLDIFLTWIIDIKPEFVYIGYDNHRNHLPEPSLAKTLVLIKELRKAGIEVREKTIREAWNETAP